MTELRKRMIEEIQLRGLSEKTCRSYVSEVSKLARYYKTSPDKITYEQIREYFVYLKNERNLSRSSTTIALCGIKFFYEKTLKWDWTPIIFVRPGKSKKLPVVLSRQEVKRLFKHIRVHKYKVILRLIYSCGLRINEALHLQVHDIDRDRQVITVRGAKGDKDLRVIQTYLGHTSPNTTAVYTHLTEKANQDAAAKINDMMTGL